MKKMIYFSIFAIVIIGLILLLLRKPPQHGNWVENQIRLPKVTLDNNHVRIEGIRDFSYTNKGIVDKSKYQTRDYNITDVKRVWYGLSHFSNKGLAHAFLSFEFTSGEYLVSSIEARIEKGKQYNPLKGLIYSYPRIMILGTEKDVIGLRSHHRNERVLLYPIKLDQSRAQNLFKLIIEDAIAIYDNPDFYNTLSDNCITGIIQYEDRWSNFLERFDYKLIFPGYSDELAHKHELIDAQGSLEELRIRAEINAKQVELFAEDFSKQIRKNWGSINVSGM